MDDKKKNPETSSEIQAACDAINAPMKEVLAQAKKFHDGTWFVTDVDITKIISTANWMDQKPAGVMVWRKKQLVDEIEYILSLSESK